MPDIGLSLVYLALLSLPGIVGSKVYRQLTRRASRKNWEDFVEILLLALFSYLVYYVLLVLGNACLFSDAPLQAKALETVRNIENKDVVLPLGEISLCSLLGVVLGFAAAFLNNSKAITRLGKFLGITKRYGDEDIWEFFHNSKNFPSWAYVKDHNLGLLYFAQIAAFSDSGKERELILENVDAYDIVSGEKRFSRDVVYLSRGRFDLTIEIPTLDQVCGVEGEP